MLTTHQTQISIAFHTPNSNFRLHISESNFKKSEIRNLSLVVCACACISNENDNFSNYDVCFSFVNGWRGGHAKILVKHRGRHLCRNSPSCCCCATCGNTTLHPSELIVGHNVATLRAHFLGHPAREADLMPLHNVPARARRSESELANTLAIRDGTTHRIGN